MRMIRSANIQQQMALLTLVPLLILTICLEFFLLQGRFADLDQGLLERGKLIARQMASNSEYGVFANNQVQLKVIANGLLREPDVRGLMVLNAASEVLLRTDEFSLVVRELSEDIRYAQNENYSQLTRANQKSNGDVQRVNLRAPIKVDSKSIWLYQPIVPTQVLIDELEARATAPQTGAVIVEMSKSNTDLRKREMLIYTLMGTTIFLLVSLYLLYVASRSITFPIRKMSVAMEQIAQGNLHVRANFTTNITEFSTLAHGLNEMAIELEQDREVLQKRIAQATYDLQEKKEEAERSSHDKSRFLAVASHDLRQPLHALGLYVSELRRQLSSSPQQHLVEQVEQSVDALATLLNALLDISKLDAGAVIPQFQPCNIATIVTRVAGDHQMLADIKNIKLVVHARDSFVRSDPVLLERILMNLVSNAIRYSRVNGRVMIACRKRGTHIRIEVRDNGIGISLVDQASVFREFFQVSKPQLDSNKGQGLGLAIVDRLVKLLGYGIELRSAPNRGAMFALQIPTNVEIHKSSYKNQDVALTRDINTVTELLPLSGKRILVIDDDELVLTSTVTILSSWGGNVDSASSAKAALQLLSERVMWDLVISDYQLGVNETGFAVIDEIRKSFGVDMPAILISGDTSADLLQLANAAGHHLLHKPVKPAKLRSLVVFLLDESHSA